MRKYPANAVADALETWPFEGAASDYKIVRGNPRASGRLDIGTGEGRRRLGIWSCTEGVFECTEQGDELQTIIRGRVILTDADGESIECVPGDSIYTRKGERLRWDIRESVTKVFFTCNRDGVPD